MKYAETECTKRWATLSNNAKEVMRQLGNFGITYDCETVKGYGCFGDDKPGKTYFNAADLRQFANGLTEVAGILDN